MDFSIANGGTNIRGLEIISGKQKPHIDLAQEINIRNYYLSRDIKSIMHYRSD